MSLKFDINGLYNDSKLLIRMLCSDYLTEMIGLFGDFWNCAVLIRQLELCVCNWLRLVCLYCQVENLFYNMAARRKTLQNSSDDYSKIVDLVSRFAIHHTNVSFSCRKVGLLNGETKLQSCYLCC